MGVGAYTMGLTHEVSQNKVANIALMVVWCTKTKCNHHFVMYDKQVAIAALLAVCSAKKKGVWQESG